MIRQNVFFAYNLIYFTTKIIICYLILDASGNPVTVQVQSVGVTDSSGNPVTG